jgi:hypothetical protein
MAAQYSTRELADLLASAPGIHGSGEVTYGLSEDTLRFLDDAVTSGSETLETGAGLSTLLFACKGAAHTCITPSAGEVERLRRHCADRGVSTGRVRFVVGESQRALPGLDAPARGLDLVLIDGGHGFPVPFVDWLFTAPRLRVGGLLVVDDTQLWTGEVLRDFLLSESAWRPEATFSHGCAFRKVSDDVLKEWNLQPYVHDRSFVWEGGGWRKLGPAGGSGRDGPTRWSFRRLLARLRA